MQETEDLEGLRKTRQALKERVTSLGFKPDCYNEFYTPTDGQPVPLLIKIREGGDSGTLIRCTDVRSGGEKEESPFDPERVITIVTAHFPKGELDKLILYSDPHSRDGLYYHVHLKISDVEDIEIVEVEPKSKRRRFPLRLLGR
jgi:hypothetical protein